jgi:hypothetical protein
MPTSRMRAADAAYSPNDLRARWVRAPGCALALLLVLCAASGVRAQTTPMAVQCSEGRCVTPATRGLGPMPGMPGPAARLSRLTRATAIFGVASAALTLSGAIWLGTSDSLQVERVGRGVMLGLTVISTPLIALPSLITRRRARVKGVPALRSVMWIGFVSTLTSDAFFVYRALHDDQINLGWSIAAGAVSTLTVLGYAYDAFQTSRQAGASRYALRLSPRGATLHVRF